VLFLFPRGFYSALRYSTLGKFYSVSTFSPRLCRYVFPFTSWIPPGTGNAGDHLRERVTFLTQVGIVLTWLGFPEPSGEGNGPMRLIFFLFFFPFFLLSLLLLCVSYQYRHWKLCSESSLLTYQVKCGGSAATNDISYGGWNQKHVTREANGNK